MTSMIFIVREGRALTARESTTYCRCIMPTDQAQRHHADHNVATTYKEYHFSCQNSKS